MAVGSAELSLAFGCFATLTGLALAEHFHHVPGAVVAFVAAHQVIRLDHGDRHDRVS